MRFLHLMNTVCLHFRENQFKDVWNIIFIVRILSNTLVHHVKKYRDVDCKAYLFKLNTLF